MTDDPAGGIELSARRLAFPQSISIEAQAALRRLVGDDGVPLNSLHVMPPSEDRAGWLSMKAVADRHYASYAKAISPNLRSSIETILVDDTVIHAAIPVDAVDASMAIIYLHGGAFVVGGGEACRAGARKQADDINIRCYGVDYRMPPDHPYPAALDDCMATYRYVLEKHDPRRIAIIGRSAGGNLAAAMLLRAKNEGLPFPNALVLLSPQVDLTESGDSFEVNRMVDVVLPGSLMMNNRLYAAGADLAHPYLSPLFGKLDGFPPTFLQSGTRDLFLSNTVRMHRSLRSAGVKADLHIFEAMPHGGFNGSTPEDLQLLAETKLFIQDHLHHGI
jgi:epsilon-lactone hydrolase